MRSSDRRSPPVPGTQAREPGSPRPQSGGAAADANAGAAAERFAVRAFADGASVFTRTTLVHNEKAAWSTPAVFGGLGVGLTVVF